MLHGLGDTCDGWSDVARKEFWGERLPHVKFVLPTAPIVFLWDVMQSIICCVERSDRELWDAIYGMV